jgi:phosphoenolpyruvate carboxylase
MEDPNVQIPKCMSTQHPDNINAPFFAHDAELSGEDEIQEAYYVFSHLGCDEQMWDCEGKEVDNFVVKKLLARYDSYFKDNRIGRDVFITLRVPNPSVERDEAKVLLETLESIPRSFDTAKLFYGDDTPPIFEVILPMTTSAKCLDRVYRYYRDFVVGKQNRPFKDGDITISDWIGTFQPEYVNVIPLFEDLEHMLASAEITREYLVGKEIDRQRVFLARSDPAMNYGLVSAVLLDKISLQRLYMLEEEVGIEIYSILGVGSAPFRGNFKPSTVTRVLEEYPAVHTFTIQSSFKYDNPPDIVRDAVEIISDSRKSPTGQVDEGRCLKIIHKYAEEYKTQVLGLAELINEVAKFVPGRRKRKLHIGLFGYARSLEGISLPRAIGFTAALYSIGIPPEILGLNALEERDIDFIRENYIHFDEDMKDSLRFLNPESLSLLPVSLRESLKSLGIDHDSDERHIDISSHILRSMTSKSFTRIEESVLQAANIRGFLG